MSDFASRQTLGLRPPKRPPATIASEGVTAHHAGPSPWGPVDRSSEAAFARTADHRRCPTIWRGFQAYHMDDRGWTDVAYNLGVCPHGLILEGRGRGVRSAANGTNAGNARSEAICYIGGSGDPLTDAARHAFLDGAARLEGGRLRWDHSDWKATECAGDRIRAWERTGWARPTSGDTSPAVPFRPLLPIHPGDRGGHVTMWQVALNLFTSETPLGNRRPIPVTGIHDGASVARTAEFERFSNAMDRLAGHNRPALQADGIPTAPTVERLGAWRALTGT